MNIVLLKREEVNGGCFSFSRQDERFRHIQKILKLAKGSLFKAGIVDGEKGIAEITAFSENRLQAHFTPTGWSIPLAHIRLILGFPRPIQLRRILRDCAGLGIEALYLTGTDLGEKSYLQADIAQEQEIERLLIDGCSQAGETLIPKVYRAENLGQLFHRYGAAICFEHVRAVLDVPQQGGDSVQAQTSPGLQPLPSLQWNGSSPLWLAAGNERGWSRKERELFAEKRFSAYSMGNRILRTETAVTSALAVCLAGAGAWA